MPLIDINYPSIPFTSINRDIDYFSINNSYFDNEFQFSKINLDFANQKTHLDISEVKSNIEDSLPETVVLNIQLGKGKTTIFHKLAEEYFNKDYLVIFLTPYIELSKQNQKGLTESFEKDDIPSDNTNISKLFGHNTENLRSKAIGKIFDGTDFSRLDHTQNHPAYIESTNQLRIHFITLNNFIGNSGEYFVEQSSAKSYYHNALFEKAKEHKVILFIDELHESINSFNPYLIHNILKWKGKIEKVFIASATFSSPCIPIIKLFSELTEKRIKVIESKRTKNSIQSSIFLHKLRFDSPRGLELLYRQIGDLKRKYVLNNNFPINIIVPTKKMSENIAHEIFQGNVRVTPNNLDNQNSLEWINLCTSETQNTYQEGQNNIGTVFKTGVNIITNKSALIIVLPNKTIFDKLKYRDIFSDGLNSLLQALGRQRNGGDIHIFFSLPDSLIESGNIYPEKLSLGKKFQSFVSLNQSFDLLKEIYNNYLEESVGTLSELEFKSLHLQDYKKRKYNFGFSFPSFDEFLLYEGNKFLENLNLLSFGGNLNAYILWACLNNQLVNATLFKITDLADKEILPIRSETDFYKFIYKQLKSIDNIDTIPFRTLINQCATKLDKVKTSKSQVSVRFEIDKKIYSIEHILNRKPKYSLFCFNAISKYKFDQLLPDNIKAYIDNCISNIKSHTSSNDKLIQVYSDLSTHLQEFDDFINTNVILLDEQKCVRKNIAFDMPERLRQNLVLDVQNLKGEDLILKSKAYSFFQDLEKADTTNQKDSLFRFFFKLRYNSNRTIMNKGVTYYVIDEKKKTHNYKRDFLKI